MRKIQVTVPHPEIYGARVEHVIEVEDDYAARVVGEGHATYLDEPEAPAAETLPAAADSALDGQDASEPQPPTAAPVADGDPAARVRRTAKADALAE